MSKKITINPVISLPLLPILIILKVLDVIDLSWGWVIGIPILVPIGFFAIAFLFMFIFAIIHALLNR